LEKLGKMVRGLESSNSGLEKILFQGMQNLGSRLPSSPNQVVPLTIADLGKIRDDLEHHGKKLTGQSVWACCLIAFWGAFRLGELLGRSGLKFDAYSDLLWEDVIWGPDWVKIQVKSAKVRGPPANLAMLFSVADRKLCPVTALARLKKSQENRSMGLLDQPVFRESNGKFLTKRVFLNIVNKDRKEGSYLITGKSFRSALPSALENFPHLFRESHLKALGRWKGRSYQVYMRNDEPEFRRIFQTVSSMLLNPVPVQESWKSDPATWTASWDSRKGSSVQKGKRNQTLSKKATRKKQREEADEE
jgi:hypothetical protein